MSDSEERSTLSGNPSVQIIVKGGTTSSRFDKEQAERKAVAEFNRDHQDKQMKASEQGILHTPDGFTASKLTSLRMMDQGAPRAVLEYLHKDKTVKQECVSEVVVLPDGDIIFTLVCPKCLERGVAHGDANIMVKNSHRKWELDTRKAGTMVRLLDPYGKEFWVKICGTIWCEEPIRCTNVGCQWAVKVGDSKVVEI